MNYVMGDLQGCADPLERALSAIDFSPSRDRIYVLGDLVNRGPDSVAVLRRLAGLGDAAVCLLGNHDLHLLAVSQGLRSVHRSDTLDGVLQDPQREHWLDWLRHQRLAVHAHGWLMVHAGVPSAWTVSDVLVEAAQVEALLRGPDGAAALAGLFGNEPARWSPELCGPDRWRFTINALTRLRFCFADGTLEFATKEGASGAPAGCTPWFDAPNRRTAGTPVAFGHWSTLGLINRPDLLALDTGCVWGGCLSVARLPERSQAASAAAVSAEIIQIPCPQAQKPGG